MIVFAVFMRDKFFVKGGVIILQVAIVNDIRLARKKLEHGLHKWFAKNSRLGTITSFNDGESLLRVFEPEKFQMVFMDILMNDLYHLYNFIKRICFLYFSSSPV